DLNQRPSGYEPDELPSCSIPRPYCVTVRYDEDHQFVATHEVPFFKTKRRDLNLGKVALYELSERRISSLTTMTTSICSDTRGYLLSKQKRRDLNLGKVALYQLS
ncbi:hypothetical protein, partial [Vibrio cidicii]|uniref:hypothetical protein n=1 Tax=Vibrio cidicii TaxID=1763883 RepID=UPI003704AF06